MCKVLLRSPLADCDWEERLDCTTNADWLWRQAVLTAAHYQETSIVAIAPCIAALATSVYSRSDELRLNGADAA